MGVSRVTGWIKLDKKLQDSIRFRRVVRKVKESNALRSVTDEQVSVSDALYETLVLGALVRLWSYADTHIDNNNTLDLTLDEIDDLVGVEGFGHALPADWLQVIDSNHVQLPDFLAHNGSSEKQRRDNARRQAEYRHRRDSHNVTRDVTGSNARNDARPEKTREEKTRPEEEHTNARSRSAKEIADEAEHHVMFQRVQKAYPPYAGRNTWLQAEHYCRVRIEEGKTWNDLVESTKRYAAYVKGGGVSDTGKVLSPLTFFSAPDKPWEQAWTLPTKIAKPAAAGWRPDPKDDPPIAEVAGHA